MSKLEELIQKYCPDGVEWKQVSEIADTFIGLATSVTKHKVSEGVLLLHNSDIQEGKIVLKKEEYLNPGFVQKNKSKILHTDDVITVHTGDVGTSAVIQEDYDGTIGFTTISSRIKDKSIISPRFLCVYLNSKNCKDAIAAKTISDRNNLNLTSFDELLIPLPPIPVQEEILKILDTYSELQAELQEALQTELQNRIQQYNCYRDNLLSFVGRSDVEWKKLGCVCFKTDNIKWNSTSETHQYIDLSSVDIQTHNILSTTTIDKHSAPSRAQQIVKENDVIFATTRPTQMRVCLIPAEYDGEICSTGYCVLRPNSSVILPQYLFFALAVDDFKVFLLNNQTMGNYPSISNNTLKEYLVPIPSISEQQKIVDILDRFNTLANDLTASLPAEIEKRRQQYEYYRDKLLTFKIKEA